MSKSIKKASKLRAEFFRMVFEPDSIQGGIIRAARPNDSSEWNEKEDARRIKKNARAFVKEYGEAVGILAARRN